MLIDMHVHIFPDEIAKRIIPEMMKVSNTEKTASDATQSDTRAKMASWGVSAFCVLNIATRPRSMSRINDSAAAMQGDGLYCFGTVHPDAENAVEEVYRIRELGLRGIKLHPDYQNFFANDKKLWPIYAAISDADLPVLFHAGWDPVSPDTVHASPEALAEVAKAFPSLRIMAAHLGGLRMPYDAIKHLSGLNNVTVDTAIASRFYTQEQYSDVISAFGAERVFFASDCPWSSPLSELDFLRSLSLPERDMDMITGGNAKRLLGITDEICKSDNAEHPQPLAL